MAGDVPQLCYGSAIKSYACFYYFFIPTALQTDNKLIIIIIIIKNQHSVILKIYVYQNKH